MGKTFAELENEALALPADQRAALARDLIASLDGEPFTDNQQAWLEEAESRYAAYQRGEILSQPASQVIAEVKAGYK